ncbi:MAG: ABC transporter permease [Candidatus Staskawiczbacteria bacterium]|nr:ABC transporter permease [Candidatus Staskawiczbacteria bacterium]
MIDFIGTIKLVFRTLLARKGRSFLTILGIVIGVSGVITIIALGAGAQSLILGQITKLGSNLLSVQPGKSNEKGPPAQVFGIVITTLTNQDKEAIITSGQVPHAKTVIGAVMGSASVTWQNKSIDTNFIGTDSDFPNVLNVTIKTGQFFSQQEDDGGANVAVLGATVADELFSNTGIDPVGQVIKVRSASQTEAGGIPLRVVGVLAKQGTMVFLDPDDQVYMPLTIGQQQLLGIHYLRAIDIKVDSAENINQTIDDIKRLLMQTHRIKKEADVDFTVRNIADAISILSTITDALRLFLTAMAAIALVVGGIGILNIMLATVAERTREIGLRKAVGASNSAIARQFLLEAGVLTFFGGIIGIIIGVIISYLISLLMHYLGYDWAFIISWWSVILATGVSILTGVIFGLYPALKASKLNPIDALRYE